MAKLKKISLTRSMLLTMQTFADAYLELVEKVDEAPLTKSLDRCRLWIAQELARRASGSAEREAARQQTERGVVEVKALTTRKRRR